MQEKLLVFFGVLCYTSIMAIVSILFDYGIFTTALLLVAFPLIWFWRQLYPSRLFLVSTVLLASATTLLFETIAHTSGIWYSVSNFDWRVAGLFPVELFFANTLLFIYIIFLHEYFVDDKKMHKSTFNGKKKWLLVFVVSIAVLGILCATLLQNTIFLYGYLWLLIGLVVTIAGSVVLAHEKPLVVLEKALHTAFLALPLLIIFEAVALLNVHLVFANPTQYLWSFSFFDNAFPIEKIAYLVLAPIWLITIYELYFDDAK